MTTNVVRLITFTSQYGFTGPHVPTCALAQLLLAYIPVDLHPCRSMDGVCASGRPFQGALKWPHSRSRLFRRLHSTFTRSGSFRSRTAVSCRIAAVIGAEDDGSPT